MAQAQYGTLITNIGLAKIANAQITQSKVGLECIALGDGNGAHYVPTTNQTALVNEVWRGPVAEVSIDPKNNNRIIIDAVIPVTVGGFTIREIGVFDDEGHLIAVGQYPEKYKPQLNEGVSEETIIHFVIETNNANVVKLNIDPTVIIASKDYVDKKFNNLDSRIGDTNKLETDYKSDTVGAINEVNDVLSQLVENMGFKEPKSAVLERGVNTVDAPIKTLCSVTALDGRTIVNYAPLLDSGLWETYQATVSLGGPDTVTVPAGKWYSTIINRDIIIVKPNTVYTLSVRHNGEISVIDPFDFNHVIGAATTGQTLTFNTGAYKSVRIVLAAPGSAEATFQNVMLNEGSTALPFVANSQGITNPTLENIRHNLIPAFHLGGSPYLPGWMNLDAIDFTRVDATSVSGSQARVLLHVVPGTKYTFACTRNAKVKISTNNCSAWEADQLVTLFEESAVTNGSMSCTFTVPAGAYFIRILFNNPGAGFIGYPRMVKGTEVPTYKAQVREALTLKTTLQAGDALKVDANGCLINVKSKYEVLDLASLKWGSYVDVGTDVKYVRVDRSDNPQVPLVKRHTETVEDFQGRILRRQSTTFDKNVEGTWSENNTIIGIVLPNAMTGWGPAYVPTQSEVQAYFMGWRMYDGQKNTNPYTGGKKYWHRLSDIPSTGFPQEGTDVLPTALAPINQWWKPYKLLCELQNTITEVVETAGSLTLDEAENMLVVSEGRVVRETANTQYYNGNYYINGTGGRLKNKAGRIIQVYKNGKATDVTIMVTAPVDIQKIGIVHAILKDYDPTAVYTVDYIPLYPFQVSAPTNPITINYAENFGSAMQLLVTAAAEIGARMSNAEQKQNFRFGKDEGGVYVVIDEEALT